MGALAPAAPLALLAGNVEPLARIYEIWIAYPTTVGAIDAPIAPALAIVAP